jgi:hypothetical protein
MRMPRILRPAVAYFCLYLGSPMLPAQAGDAYLDMLEEEAQVLELMKSAERLDASAQANAPGITGQNATRAVLDAGMSHEQFDAALQTYFVGTYMLYGKLSEEQKDAVYTHYQRDGQIMEIRRAIAEHL